jgi:hypothetical protein
MLVYEYVIVVDPYIPGLIAVKTPLEGSMLATLVFEDDHVPPEVELDKVAVEPEQIDIGAEIGERFVWGFTVTVVVTGLLGHPFISV